MADDRASLDPNAIKLSLPPFSPQLSCELQQLHFEVVEGSPGKCSKACGPGWQELHSFCVLPDGFMADMALCPANTEQLSGAAEPAGAARLLPCNNGACSANRWEVRRIMMRIIPPSCFLFWLFFLDGVFRVFRQRRESLSDAL